jgi:hypothetical protein
MPKTAAALCLLLLVATLSYAGDALGAKGKGAKPRRIRSGPVFAVRGSHDRPTLIATEKELREAVRDRMAEAAILKQVDFRKEHLLLFCWSGSRGDLLVPAEGKAGEANFTFTPGKEKNNALHVGLFAVPARAKVKVTAP